MWAGLGALINEPKLLGFNGGESDDVHGVVIKAINLL